MPGLICYERHGYENDVPGCGGVAERNTDYCIVDPSMGTSPPTTWEALYDQLEPPNDKDEGDAVTTIPSSSINAAPSKQPTKGPSVSPTNAPSAQSHDTSVWDAFVSMINKYADAKGEASFEPTAEESTPSNAPTTEFYAAWTQSVKKWKATQPTLAPTTEFHALWAGKINKWKSTNVQNDDKDVSSDSP